MKNPGYISGWTMNYLGGWNADYQTGKLATLKFDEITHLVYSYLSVAADASLYSGFGWDFVLRTVEAGHAHGVPVIISINSVDSLMPIVDSDALLATFVTNVKNILIAYDAEGVGIDWENRAAYGARYHKLVSALYSALHPIGKIITISGAWDWTKILNLPSSDAYMVEFVEVMTYDMSYSPATAYPPDPSSFEDIVAAVNAWVNAGWPKDKILPGIPFYGEGQNGAHVLYSEIVPVVNPTPEQNEANITSISTPRGTIALTAPLVWNGIDRVIQKVRYVKENLFGGVFFFDIGEDMLNNDPRSLLDAAYSEMVACPITFDLAIAVSGQGTTTPAPGNYQIDAGAVVTVEARPATGWHLANWSNNPAWTDNPTSWTMVEGVAITAVFEQDAAPPPPSYSSVGLVVVLAIMAILGSNRKGG